MGIKSDVIIGGADGPTAIFLLDKSKEPTFKQRIQRRITRIKRYFIAKRIHPGTHSLQELGEYLVSKHGFIEASISDPTFAEEYEQMRISLLFEHRPDLTGERCFPNIDNIDDPEAVLKELKEAEQKDREIAEAIPKEVFDIDYHKYVRVGKKPDDVMDIAIERNHAYIGGGASGSKAYIRKWNKIFKDAYLYYGVSDEDIKTKSERYQKLIMELSMK